MRLVRARGDFEPAHPRRQVEFLVREGVGYGLLSDDQSAIVARVLELDQQTVAQEMVPWRNLPRVRPTDGLDRLRELAGQTPRYRVPVVDDTGNPVGVINLLHALLSPPDAFPGVEAMMTPIHRLPRTTRLRDALDAMRQHRAALAVVTDARGQPLGAVTLKDLIEPITGELSNW